MDRGELETLITRIVQSATKTITDSLHSLHDEVISLKEELKEKDEIIQELEARLDSKVDELEQYGRRNNLRIFGVKEREGECTDDIVLTVASKMDVTFDRSVIDRSHRIGAKGSENRPRPIIVKFVSYAHRSQMFRAKKNLKGSNITVREDLTRERLKVLKGAASAYGVKKVWSIDGVIKVKVGERSAPISVRNKQQLDSLLQKHPPATSY
ncbi:LINE-1 retrotransposable element ORF1 protein [Frankliniella fusca]|uniref:LINE-1 retrotransposable element ORF1 protein n=1 Tax=Frankliniella fusca TaxID=407009 RepID=A0AAE1HGE4_9NEOP|nr:LINE-1 retrotransposable element ORF1 protein [Frankliniella fusca]